MSTSVSSLTTNFFPSAENGFTTTTSGSVSSGATTVGLNSVAGYTNGEVAVFVIDPTDVSKKQTFTGVIDTAGVQVTDVVWTAGTNQTHALGATVVDYATATHISMITKGIGIHADQDGTLKAGAVDATAVIADGVVTKAKFATAVKSDLDSGWSTRYGDTTFPAPDTVTANGNRSYDLVFNSVDLTSYISPGMRLRTTRTTTAPTQCTDLESGSSQYYSKTSPAAMTFTDDFVVSAWIKLESYTGASQVIASRANGTQGWIFSIQSDGTVTLTGYNAALTNYSRVASYQSIPLGKWVHVAAQLDMSTFTATTTTSYIMFDGVNVPAAVSRAGTNPTALVQAGNLEIGSYNAGTSPFDGKIAQVAIYNAKVTQATILASMHQTLTGSETSLISAYSFNNTINDLNTTNANNLTANGSAVATATDSPFSVNSFGTATGTTDYAIVTKAVFSTNTTLTVQVPEGNTIPTSGGVSAVAYSPWKAPYGMPIDEGKWRVSTLLKSTNATTSNATYGAFLAAGYSLVVPVGSWQVGHRGGYTNATTTVVYFNLSPTALTGLSAQAGLDLSPLVVATKASAASNTTWTSVISAPAALSAAATYVMYTFGATTSAAIDAVTGHTELFAEFALL